MEAANLKAYDMDYRNHLQAFLNFAAKATKKSGRPVFSTFDKFFNANKELRRRKSLKETYNKKRKLPKIAEYLGKEGE